MPIEARAAGDALDVDNHRYLALPVRQAIRALCIDGRPSGGSFRGAADYLAVALAPQGETIRPRRRCRPKSPRRARCWNATWRRYDCLFLCNVAQFTASEARALDAYLQGGGCVVFFLGDQVLADRYNRELGVAGEGRAGGPHILPARLGNVIDRPQFRLDPLGYRHPILQAFRGRGQTSLLTTPVFKHYQLTPPAELAGDDGPGAGQRRSAGDRAVGSPRAGRVGRHVGRAVVDRHAALAEFRSAGSGDRGLVCGRATPAAKRPGGRDVRRFDGVVGRHGVA